MIHLGETSILEIPFVITHNFIMVNFTSPLLKLTISRSLDSGEFHDLEQLRNI